MNAAKRYLILLSKSKKQKDKYAIILDDDVDNDCYNGCFDLFRIS